ncbi:hypothetical protein BH24ACT4_BH24ACT4_17400 [soil metagenome]
MTKHPTAGQTLRDVLEEVAAGRPPPSDGRVEVLPSQGPDADDVVLATDGHLVIACDLPPDEVRRRFRPGEYPSWCQPAPLLWLCEQLGRAPGTADIALVATHCPDSGLDLVMSSPDHPRLSEGLHHRTGVRTWRTPDEAGMVAVGPGLAGRWELAYELDPSARGRGAGAALARAARSLIPAGETLWAQTTPGNVGSVRALLRAGFVPVAGETLLRPRP